MGVDANKNIASSILECIVRARSGEISLQDLEDNIDASLAALDSIFPKEMRGLLSQLVANIRKQQAMNSAVALNTPAEFDYDEKEGRSALFDAAADALRAYIG